MNRQRAARSGPILALCTLALVLGITVVPAASADDAQERRLEKQVRVFETALDDMLVESPNLLVRSREATHGLYMDGKGAVFTFRMGLNTNSWDSDGDHWWNWLRVDDGEVIILSRDGARVEDYDEWAKDRLPRQAELYEDGKEEIKLTILDFGVVMSELADDDWIVVKARLRGAAYFKEEDIRTLEMKIQMRDVRAYAAGRISEDQAKGKIQVEES